MCCPVFRIPLQSLFLHMLFLYFSDKCLERSDGLPKIQGRSTHHNEKKLALSHENNTLKKRTLSPSYRLTKEKMAFSSFHFQILLLSIMSPNEIIVNAIRDVLLKLPC